MTPFFAAFSAHRMAFAPDLPAEFAKRATTLAGLSIPISIVPVAFKSSSVFLTSGFVDFSASSIASLVLNARSLASLSVARTDAPLIAFHAIFIPFLPVSTALSIVSDHAFGTVVDHFPIDSPIHSQEKSTRMFFLPIIYMLSSYHIALQNAKIEAKFAFS
ncbi:hypothetical protein H7170_00465 [Candidatus Gracilibacteria bacterium]|nr:hypothetical protein [Candidatus Gracilibacteria bacterium]